MFSKLCSSFPNKSTDGLVSFFSTERGHRILFIFSNQFNVLRPVSRPTKTFRSFRDNLAAYFANWVLYCSNFPFNFDLWTFLLCTVFSEPLLRHFYLVGFTSDGVFQFLLYNMHTFMHGHCWLLVLVFDILWMLIFVLLWLRSLCPVISFATVNVRWEEFTDQCFVAELCNGSCVCQGLFC